MCQPYYDFLIVGAGLSGATLAERLAAKGKTVLIIDKRNHIGGNCYDYVDPATSIRVSKYGTHLFHTDDEEVWNYVNRFSEWTPFYNKVITQINETTFVPVPANIETINALCGTNLRSPQDAAAWLAANQIPLPQGAGTKAAPANSEEVALSRVGRVLYETLFKPYTIKQWAKTPAQLAPEVLARIPVRDSWDNRYFSDRYQALPTDGYTSLFVKMLAHPNITTLLGVSYESVAATVQHGQVIFTWRIDQFFKAAGLPELEYRSLRFEERRLPTPSGGFAQRNSVVNYASGDIPYTRSIEYKWYPNCPVAGQSAETSIVVYETSCDCSSSAGGSKGQGQEQEPYYPVPSSTNQELYEKYRELAAANSKVHFIGRLASYKYFNMDQAIRAALDYFEKHFT
jgi:UDP-galactopyranose mutase